MMRLKILSFTAIILGIWAVFAQVPPKPSGQPVAETVTVLHGTNLMPSSAEMIIKGWIGDGADKATITNIAAYLVNTSNKVVLAIVDGHITNTALHLTHEQVEIISKALTVDGGTLTPSAQLNIYNPKASTVFYAEGVVGSRLDNAPGALSYRVSLEGLSLFDSGAKETRYGFGGILYGGSYYLLPDKGSSTNVLATAGDIKPEADPFWTLYSTNVLAHTESNHRVTEHGGFTAGHDTVMTPLDMGDGFYLDGVAIGWQAYSAEGSIGIGGGVMASDRGVAVGSASMGLGGGVGIGYGATSSGVGGAGGGAALGDSSKVIGAGGAVGKDSWAGDGFAGGKNAQTKDGPKTIDAIQLGSGVNAETNTLKVYGHTLLKADGKIPKERINLTAADVGALPLTGGMMNGPNATIIWEDGNLKVGISSTGLTLYDTVTYRALSFTHWGVMTDKHFFDIPYDTKPEGNYTFATLDDIPAPYTPPVGLVTNNQSSVTFGNITLGGVQRDTWPEGIAPSIVTNITKSVGDSRYIKSYNGDATNINVHGYLALPQTQATNLVLRIVTSNEYIIVREVWE